MTFQWKPTAVWLDVISCIHILESQGVVLLGCQPDEPLTFLATTNRIINVYGFLVVVMLLMYDVFYCLYSIGNKINTNTTVAL